MKIGSTPRELLQRVTVAEIVEMMAFERLEPFGGMAEDYRAGVVAATVANVQRSAQQDPYQAQDFMPALREPTVLLGEGMTPDELSDLIDAKIFGRVH